MSNKILQVIFFVCIQFGCSYNEFDAKRAADDYCKCLANEKESGKNFFDSRSKCDGKLLAKNKFYRYDYIDRNYSYRYYSFFLSRKFLDSASTFRHIFFAPT